MDTAISRWLFAPAWALAATSSHDERAMNKDLLAAVQVLNTAEDHVA
jgi:hypothetical protein